MKRKYEKPMAFEEVFAAENYCTTACYKIACAIHSNPDHLMVINGKIIHIAVLKRITEVIKAVDV